MSDNLSATSKPVQIQLTSVAGASPVTAGNPLPVTSSSSDANVISTLNSRLPSAMASGEVFQGVGEQAFTYGRAGIHVRADNATDGVLIIESSHDGVTYGGPAKDVSNTLFAAPHMWNLVAKFFRIKYTNGNTAATNLSIQTQFSSNADVLLAHQLDVALINETEALIVRSVGVGQNPVDVYTNKREAGMAFSTTANVSASGTFSSDVLTLSGYSQVQTEILSDKDGTINITFYSDAAGTDVVRSLAIPYTASAGYQLFGAPVFVDYVKYQFTNNEATDTTDFYFTTKFLTQASSPQLLRTDTNVVPAMIASLTRSVNHFDLDSARKHVVGQRAFFFFGHNLAVGTSYEDLWPVGGDYPWPTSASAVEAVSTHAADDCGREVTKIVCDSRTNTTDGQYFDITAQDGTLYRVYMDTTGADATQPATGGRTLTKVDIFTGVADTATGSGDALALVLDALSDFGCPSPGNGTVYATDANAGTVTDAINGDLANAWAITTHAQGATAGLGLLNIEMHGLSSTGADIEDIILLHGTTASPPTVQTYFRVNLAHCETVGSYGASHQGTVSVQIAGGGTVLSSMGGDDTAGISFGYGEAQNGFTTIPLGKVAYITRIEVKPNNLGTNKHVSVALMEREDILQVTSPFGPRRVLWSEEEFTDPIVKVFKSHIKIKALADLWFRGKGSAASKIAVSCDYYLVDADSTGA